MTELEKKLAECKIGAHINHDGLYYSRVPGGWIVETREESGIAFVPLDKMVEPQPCEYVPPPSSGHYSAHQTDEGASRLTSAIRRHLEKEWS